MKNRTVGKNSIKNVGDLIAGLMTVFELIGRQENNKVQPFSNENEMPGKRYRDWNSHGIGEKAIEAMLLSVYNPVNQEELVLVLRKEPQDPIIILPSEVSRNILPFVKNNLIKQAVLDPGSMKLDLRISINLNTEKSGSVIDMSAETERQDERIMYGDDF